MTLEQLEQFHLLYERTAADLAKITTFSSEPETRRYLENLVARAYGEIHETRERPGRHAPLKWFFQTLPQTFRRHVRAFYLSVAITLAGCAFGGLALAFDPAAKPVLMPFSHLQQDPTERVAEEESATQDRLAGHKTSFSAFLMTHNIRVSIFTLALGMTWGVGTFVMLFYNGIMLGAVAVDYVLAGQTKFLLGWLLPHGVVEIPAILIAGQAGLVLAMALIGRGQRIPLGARLRAVSQDLVTLIFGVGLLLVWAGFVEAFLSQYHEPVIPYSAKIAFGLVELVLLFLFSRSRATQSPGCMSSGRDASPRRPLPPRTDVSAKVHLDPDPAPMNASELRIRPEGIVFSQLLAGPVTRFLAWFVDLLCILALLTILGQVLLVMRLVSANLAGALYTLGYFVISIGYGMFCEWRWRGQTIGKRLLRLRVVDAEGLRLQFNQIVTRNLLRFVDSLPFLYFVGGVACWLSPKCQRLGDIAANTIVIRNPRVAQPDLDQLLAGKFNSLRQYPHLAARLRQRVSAGRSRRRRAGPAAPR